ncbi:MAG: DUF6320 domain-containing protein [Christensenellales bacterium]|jgi:hypothetical protein
MSYCVNCGVELEKSEKCCPLCGVEAINPVRPFERGRARPYPPRVHKIQSRVNKIFWSNVVSIILAFIGAVCLITDLLFTMGSWWSLYVLVSLMLAWVFFCLPLLLRTFSMYKCLTFDFMAVLLFLLLLNAVKRADWFLSLGVPITLLLWLFSILMVRGVKVLRIKHLYIPALACFALAVVVVLIELLVNLYIDNTLRIVWSFYALIPLVALGILFIVMERNKKLKEEIVMRLHL